MVAIGVGDCVKELSLREGQAKIKSTFMVHWSWSQWSCWSSYPQHRSFYKDITFLPKHGKFFLFLVAKHEHALYDKEKVAKTNETEKNDRSSTNNGVIARAEVTELTEQVVTFNICAVKATEKVAIDNADDVPAEQAVPGEPELKQTPIKQSDDEATIHVKQSDNETLQKSNTDEELPSVVDI